MCALHRAFHSHQIHTLPRARLCQIQGGRPNLVTQQQTTSSYPIFKCPSGDQKHPKTTPGKRKLMLCLHVLTTMLTIPRILDFEMTAASGLRMRSLVELHLGTAPVEQQNLTQCRPAHFAPLQSRNSFR